MLIKKDIQAVRKLLKPILKDLLKELMPIIKEIAVNSAKHYVEQELKKREK